MAALVRRRAVSLAKRPGLIAFILFFVLTIPAWREIAIPGYFDTHDGLFHLFRLVEFDRAIRSGELYPRLAPDLSLGYDYPVFNFYSPLSTLVAEAFRLVGFGYIASVKASLVLILIAGGVGMLLYARTFLPRPAAFVAGIAYVYLPYILLDIYVRGALAESFALAWIPWCLFALSRLTTGVGPGKMALAGFTLAGLLLSHNVTTVLFSPVLVTYSLVLAWKARAESRGVSGRSVLIGAACSALLALVLSAFYWLPAYSEQGLVASGRLTADFFNYKQHFQAIANVIQRSLAFDYRYDFFAGFLFRMGVAQAILAVLGLLVAATRGRFARLHGIYWSAVIVVSLALMTPRSAPIWQALPLIEFAQFPWRLLGQVAVASSVLIGYLAALPYRQHDTSAQPVSSPAEDELANSPSSPSRPAIVSGIARAVSSARCVWPALAVAAVVASSLWWLSPRRLDLREDEVRPWTIQRMELDRRLVDATVGEYIPGWASVMPWDFKSLPAESAGRGDFKATVRDAGASRYDLDVSANGDSTVIFDRFFFDGWAATIDGHPAAVRHVGPLGLLAVDVPNGDHRLEVWFGDTPVRTAGWIVSAIGAVILVALILASRRLGGPMLSVPSYVNRRRRMIVTAFVVVVGLGFGPAMLSPRLGWYRTVPVAADFDYGIRLAGAHVGTPDSRGRLPVTLYWQARTRVPVSLDVDIRLLSPDGRVVGQREKSPLFGLRGTTLWEAGQITRDHQEVALDDGIPAGEYRVVVSLVDPGSHTRLAPTGAPVVEWKEDAANVKGISLGKVQVGERQDADPGMLARSSGAAFGDWTSLESYDLLRRSSTGASLPLGGSKTYAATLAQGDVLRILMRWHSLRDVDEDYAIYTHLLDDDQKMIAQDDEWPHRGFYPTSLWLPDDRVLDHFDIRIPSDTPMGRYQVVIGMYRRSDLSRLSVIWQGAASDGYSLGHVKVAPNPPLNAESLRTRRRTDARLAQSVTLLGYDWKIDAPGVQQSSATPRRGSKMALSLFWQTDDTIAESYTVFVHLIGPSGALAAQSDSQPSGGHYPTSLWAPGEVVADQHTIDLPRSLPPGKYRLVAGMYQLSSGARLKLPDGQDSVLLEEFSLN